MADIFSTAVTIDAGKEKVWAALTEPQLMAAWMGTPEMKLQVQAAGEVHTPVIIKGFHHVFFENKGRVLQSDKYRRFSYSHLSSVSRLADRPENYTVLEFILTPAGAQTLLTLNITNFPTETIRKHLEFYWRTTIMAIKKSAEAL